MCPRGFSRPAENKASRAEPWLDVNGMMRNWNEVETKRDMKSIYHTAWDGCSKKRERITGKDCLFQKFQWSRPLEVFYCLCNLVFDEIELNYFMMGIKPSSFISVIIWYYIYNSYVGIKWICMVFSCGLLLILVEVKLPHTLWFYHYHLFQWCFFLVYLIINEGCRNLI